MVIQGHLFKQGSAASHPATLHCVDGAFSIQTEDGLSVSGSLEDIQVSDRLGNVERKLTMNDGAVFATSENDAIDALFESLNPRNRFVHHLESSIGWVLCAFVVTVLVSISFFRWGIPWVSTTIAHALPQETNALISKGSMTFLDKYFFEESSLDVDQRTEITAHFESRLLDLEHQASDIDYQLHFRSWNYEDKGIPNAFALPSGDIILTDKFVELSENQDQIDAVLLHEMGHVVHRHSLESVISGGLVAGFVMLVTGDNSALVDVGFGVGALLVNSNYSRSNESEADVYAFEKMLDGGIDPNAFSKIMDSMDTYMRSIHILDNTEEDQEAQDQQEQNTEGQIETDTASDSEAEQTIFDYLSSHPATEARIEQARIYSECFKKGQNPCELPE